LWIYFKYLIIKNIYFNIINIAKKLKKNCNKEINYEGCKKKKKKKWCKKKKNDSKKSIVINKKLIMKLKKKGAI